MLVDIGHHRNSKCESVSPQNRGISGSKSLSARWNISVYNPVNLGERGGKEVGGWEEECTGAYIC